MAKISSNSTTIKVSASLDKMADWIARSTGAGVTHAENWSSYADAAAAWSSPRTLNWNKTPSMGARFSNAFELITTPDHVLSGKALRLWHGKNNYGDPGTIDNQYMFVPFNGNRNALPGPYPGGSYLTKCYVQVCFWTGAFVDYYWRLGDGSVGGSKFFIIDTHSITASTGELVITDGGNQNFIRPYRITINGGSAAIERSIKTPGNNDNIQRHNAIDNGTPLSDEASYRRRYGPMYTGMVVGNSQSLSLTQQGVPDKDAAQGSVAINKYGTTVVEVELDLAADRCRVWQSHHGNAPKLTNDTALNGGKGLFGDRVKPDGVGWSGICLSNLIYTATGAKNPNYPTDAYTDFSEIIISQNPINFPGGHRPSGV